MIPLDHWMLPKGGLSREHHTAIGRLIASWARFEVVLAKSLAYFIVADSKSNTDRTAAFISTTGMDAKVKIGLMKSIFRYRFPGEADRFDHWSDEVFKVKRIRDLAAHSMWVKAKRPGYVRAYGMTSVGKIKLYQNEYNAKDFLAATQEIGGLTFDLCGFLWRWLGVISLPMPKTRDQSEEAKLVRRVLKAVGNRQNKAPRTRRKPSSRPKVSSAKTKG